MFLSLKVRNLIPKNWDPQQSTMIQVEGTIVSFGFSKKIKSFTPFDRMSNIRFVASFHRVASVDVEL
jgi:hypothetical protein